MTEGDGWRSSVPWAMVWARAAACPLIAFGAHRGWDGRWLGVIVVAALVDDIFDGILARRWSCDTPALRLADSSADTVFYLGVALALWWREPRVLRAHWLLLSLLALLEVSRYSFDFWKFGRGASYHSYLAKLWGFVMAVAVIGVFSFSDLGWLLGVALLLGVAANCEGLAMSLILPRWRHDVPTLRAAWQLRRELLGGRSA